MKNSSIWCLLKSAGRVYDQLDLNLIKKTTLKTIFLKKADFAFLAHKTVH